MRLFAAILPPATVLEHLETALRTVRGPLDAGDARGALRWTDPHDRHLTAAFFGEVPEGYLPELAEELVGVAARHPTLSLQLRGAGTFDHRTLWVGCGGDVEPFSDLAADCVAVGEQLTGRGDHRVRSRAHVTVARVRPGSRSPRRGTGRPDRRAPALAGPDVGDLARALAVYQDPTWTAPEIVLVASQLDEGRGGGPAHEVVARARLGRATGGAP